MRETRYWTWHMVAGVVIFFFLGLHMLIMHLGGLTGLFTVSQSVEATDTVNSLARDRSWFFTITYVVLLGAALYHGLYGLKNIIFELTLKPAMEKVVAGLLLVVGIGLFTFGAWAAFATHQLAQGGI